MHTHRLSNPKERAYPKTQNRVINNGYMSKFDLWTKEGNPTTQSSTESIEVRNDKHEIKVGKSPASGENASVKELIKKRHGDLDDG